MESCKLEITVHCAKDLEDVKHLGTMDPYAVFWISGYDQNSTKQTSNVSKDGGSSPSWECQIEFDIDPLQEDYILICEIKHDGMLFDRNIGEVRVCFSELLTGAACGERVSYPVSLPSGDQVKGELILSHKFSELVSPSDGDKKGGPSEKVEKKTGGTMKRVAVDVAGEVVAGLIVTAVVAAL